MAEYTRHPDKRPRRESLKLHEIVPLLEGDLSPQERENLAKVLMKMGGGDVIYGGGGGGGGGGGVTILDLTGIIRYASGRPYFYTFDETGLTRANDDASSGEIIFYPAGTITLTKAITIAAGVSWVGMGRENTIINVASWSGTFLTMSAGSSLENLTLTVSSASSGTNKAISATSAYLYDLNVEMTNSNASPYVHIITASATEIRNCMARATNTAGYGGKGYVLTSDCRVYDSQAYLDFTGVENDTSTINCGFDATDSRLENCHVDIICDANEGFMYGYDLDTCDVFNSYAYVNYQGAADDGASWGFKVDESKLFNCHTYCNTLNDDSVIGFRCDGGTTGAWLFDCTARVNSMSELGDAYIYGLWTESGTTHVIDGYFDAVEDAEGDGEAVSIKYDTGSTLNLYSAVYTDVTGGGTINYYGIAPTAQQSEITDELTTITHTAPGTPDYALQDLIDSAAGSAFGFATKDEGNTLLSVVVNNQARIKELEDALTAFKILTDAD